MKRTHLVLPLAAGNNSLDTAYLDMNRSSDSERYLLTGSRSCLKAESSICGFTGLLLLLLGNRAWKYSDLGGMPFFLSVALSYF